jgi:hypothetical protein|tara:strand:- start:200 stop:367 length:168 start_codon:yes stop_codon:yes gene_type:complete
MGWQYSSYCVAEIRIWIAVSVKVISILSAFYQYRAVEIKSRNIGNELISNKKGRE